MVAISSTFCRIVQLYIPKPKEFPNCADFQLEHDFISLETVVMIVKDQVWRKVEVAEVYIWNLKDSIHFMEGKRLKKKEEKTLLENFSLKEGNR